MVVADQVGASMSQQAEQFSLIGQTIVTGLFFDTVYGNHDFSKHLTLGIILPIRPGKYVGGCILVAVSSVQFPDFMVIRDIERNGALWEAKGLQKTLQTRLQLFYRKRQGGGSGPGYVCLFLHVVEDRTNGREGARYDQTDQALCGKDTTVRNKRKKLLVNLSSR